MKLTDKIIALREKRNHLYGEAVEARANGFEKMYRILTLLANKAELDLYSAEYAL